MGGAEEPSRKQQGAVLSLSQVYSASPISVVALVPHPVKPWSPLFIPHISHIPSLKVIDTELMRIDGQRC